MKTQPSPPRRRNPVAKALRHHPGGPHRGTPSRADRKRELRRQLDATAPAGRSQLDCTASTGITLNRPR